MAGNGRGDLNHKGITATVNRATATASAQIGLSLRNRRWSTAATEAREDKRRSVSPGLGSRDV